VAVGPPVVHVLFHDVERLQANRQAVQVHGVHILEHVLALAQVHSMFGIERFKRGAGQQELMAHLRLMGPVTLGQAMRRRAYGARLLHGRRHARVTTKHE
jgi:hypothetical protein